jgi:mRNA (guanine-N7-)-methyltransferase
MAKRGIEDYSKHAARIDEHYSSKSNNAAKSRKHSPTYALRQLNNFCKRQLIASYVPQHAYVLDLAMGKGGDLQKMHDAEVLLYFGIDVAHASVIAHASDRYNSSVYRRFDGFTARMLHGDAFTGDVQSALSRLGFAGEVFDIVSMQFALHYAFHSENVARSAVRNVSSSLCPGGLFIGITVDSNVIVKKLREHLGLAFGNSVYRVEFDQTYSNKTFNQSNGAFGLEYAFTLEGAVDQCKEWLVHKKELQRLAQEESLELVTWTNLHEYITTLVQSDASARSMMFSHLQDAELDEDEWEAIGLYVAFVFRKVGDKSTAPPRPEPPSKRPITGEDIVAVPSSSIAQEHPPDLCEDGDAQ